MFNLSVQTSFCRWYRVLLSIFILLTNGQTGKTLRSTGNKLNPSKLPVFCYCTLNIPLVFRIQPPWPNLWIILTCRYSKTLFTLICALQFRKIELQMTWKVSCCPVFDSLDVPSSTDCMIGCLFALDMLPSRGHVYGIFAAKELPECVY